MPAAVITAGPPGVVPGWVLRTHRLARQRLVHFSCTDGPQQAELALYLARRR